MPDHSLPPPSLDGLSRVALVNPTRYLGNLLLAGGLIQGFVAHCRARSIEVLLLFDEAYAPLLEGSLPDARLLFYPRAQLKRASPLGRLRPWWRCLRELRAFRADLAFNIEDDSVSDRFTRWSAATRKLGCGAALPARGYDWLLPIDFVARPEGRSHRWHAYEEVFTALGLPETKPRYLRLALPGPGTALQERWTERGLPTGQPWVALHAGATKDYKKWPAEHFAGLARRLLRAGFQPLLLGAGEADRRANAEIRTLLGEDDRLPDFTDSLSLVELAQLLQRCAATVGNDSGPFHLAAALGLPGVVIFGPTEDLLWRPLSARAELISGRSECAPECTRRLCALDRRCLRSITPEKVFRRVEAVLAKVPES